MRYSYHHSADGRAIPRSLGAAILHRRKELGLTQAALAERVATAGDWGFRQSDISRLERGIVTLPSFTRMRSLATALEVPVGELLALSGWTGAEHVITPPRDSEIPSVPRDGKAEGQAAAIEAPPDALALDRATVQRLLQELAHLREQIDRLQATLAVAAEDPSAGGP